MASSINADNGVSSGSAGLKSTADSSGVLALQTNGTTAISIDASQAVSFTNQPTYSGGTANGVAYLNGSKVLTTGSALTFDGTNLGVNQASPSYKIDAIGSTTNSSGIVTTLRLKNGGTAANDGAKILFTAGTSTDGAGIGSGGQALNSADLRFYTGGSTQAMTLDVSGRLGITETSPTAKLHIGVASAAVDGTKGVRITNPAGTIVMLECGSGGDSFVGTTSGSDFNIRTNNITRATFDNSGNLLVGTTSAGGYKFNCLATTSYAGNFTTGAGNVALVLGITSGTGTQTYQLFYNGVTNTGSISTTGTNTLYNSVSDYRLKENIAPMTGALSVVQQLKPCTYTWKADNSVGQGFVAHELQAIFPDCVSGEKDAVNEDGSIKPQGIDTSFLVATLTAAIQEQQAIIQSLTDRLTVLENK